MRNFFVTLMTSLLSCSAAFAFFPEAVDSNLEIGVGYRHDSFKWTTSASGGSSASGVEPVGIRSELKWKNLRIWQIEARGNYVTCDNIYLRAYGDYGWITHGRNTDIDYETFGGSGSGSSSSSSSGTTFVSGSEEIASSHGKSRRGHVYDGSIGAGYQFKMCDDSFALSPLVGYSWHGQHLNINHNGFGSSYDSYYSSYDSSYDSSYSSSGYGSSRSRYHARWNGPWLGFDFDYKLCMCNNEWSIFGSYEYHWAWYHASGHFNRADLLDGFHQRSKRADGQIFTIGGRWDLCDNWTVGILGQFQWWEARHGRDRALISEVDNGDIKTKCFTSIPLKRVRWDSQSVSINVGMAF